MNEPEALRLADLIDTDLKNAWHHDEAATELRRLHAVNVDLLAALKECVCFIEYDPGNVVGHMARAAIAKAEGEQK